MVIRFAIKTASSSATITPQTSAPAEIAELIVIAAFPNPKPVGTSAITGVSN